MAIPFTISIPTAHGQMLVNRYDINQTNSLIKTCAGPDIQQISIAQHICSIAPEGSVMLDIGANFGSYALSCASALRDKGGIVHAFEAQRIISYMLSGSAVLNGYENLFVHHACVGNDVCDIPIPRFDYTKQMNFGSIEFGKEQKEQLHQQRGISNESVKQVRIDDFNFEKVCFVKIDVEGMETKVLEGAIETFRKSMPVIQIEILKSDLKEIFEKVKAISEDYIICRYDDCDVICMSSEKTASYGIDINSQEIIRF
ncbi:FkbM family methyltransferase [Intestinirhabdus alba]|jgi:FkbM family methyltransferase|uniref:FkbM family methyltransferase n=1 Tax=Intestinirhabdus alba TaxID=2899544 RepID=A0A6L6IMB0_9ENTR|nr:FkbM family methyltransferase [Intestinirhabdus alba]MTH47325.1 FkbM family methyltransferase [Intestinirhabdus alba]